MIEEIQFIDQCKINLIYFRYSDQIIDRNLCSLCCIIMRGSSYQLQLSTWSHRLRTASYEALSILQIQQNQRKKGSCHSGRTKEGMRLNRHKPSDFPQLKTTCIVKNKYPHSCHGIQFCSQFQSSNCNLLRDHYPIRILNWDWSPHQPTLFHRDFQRWLKPSDRPEHQLIFLCRGTCRYQLQVLQIWRC